MKLNGKVVFITGAAGGIGREAASIMAEAGGRIVIADIQAEAAAKAAAEIEAAGGTAHAVAMDITDPDSVSNGIDAALAAFGRIDVLYNNAGGSRPIDSTVVDAPLDEFWRVIKVDLYGTFLVCRFGIPALIAAGGGSVINTVSAVALMGIPNMDSYTAAKGGVAAMTRSMAVEFASKGVRVNAISPGLTMTERAKQLSSVKSATANLAERQVLGVGLPSEIAQTALFLASDASSRLTGTIIPVDGGLTIA